jgi:protein arginine kinase activator
MQDDMDHLCDACKEHEGVVRIAQSFGRRTSEVWLCERCSKQHGIESRPVFGGVGELISGLIDRAGYAGRSTTVTRCPTCSTSFAAIKRSGRVGCSDCYKSFGEQIGRLLTRAAGATRHTGKSPARLSKYKRAFVDRERLRRDLDDALTSEDYERAARIRDSLHSIDRETESDDAFSP